MSRQAPGVRPPVAVLVVEDDAVAAEAHAAYVERVPGLQVLGSARTAQDAFRILGERRVDLVLLDMNLPDGHGLDVLRRLRGSGYGCDVIAVTSARELDVVRRAVEQGVVSYVLKPFTFAGLRAKLETYLAYRAQVDASDGDLAQHEVDHVLGLLRPAADPSALPKGVRQETLDRVVAAVRDWAEDPRGPSASEAATTVGVSRVTARRYLEHLATTGVVERRSHHLGAGRPEVRYRAGS